MTAMAGNIKGTVLDKQTKEPLTGATIQITGTAQGVVADIDGNYTLNVNDGTYTITVRYIGYKDILLNSIKVKAETLLNFEMESDAQALGEVSVVAKKNLEGERALQMPAPQAFIVLSADDGAVPPMNSIGYFLALNQQKVPVSMHIYPIGGHGWGFRDNFTYKRQWTEELEKWLRDGVKLEKIINISTHEKIDFYHLSRITPPRPSGTGRPLRPVDQSEVDQYQQGGSPEYIHFLCHRRRCYRQRPDERSQPPIPQREMEVQLCGKLCRPPHRLHERAY